MKIIIFFLVFGPSLNVEYEAQADTITLNWNEPDEGGGAAEVGEYFVRWRTGGQTEENQLVTDTSIQIPNLLSNAEYYIEIFAHSSINSFGDAAVISATTG